MIEIIKTHNRLNGVMFCTIEFGIMFILVGLVAIFFLIYHAYLLAVIALGISLNCLPVVMLGLKTLIIKNKEETHSKTIWNKSARAKLMNENPQMGRSTLILAIATLLPFVVCFATLYESRQKR